MLSIFNNLKPFIEDNYSEYGVREYAKLIGVSPPTASKLLKEYDKEGLLKSRKDRLYSLYRANRNSAQLADFARSYWRMRLSILLSFISEEFNYSKIILFGSLSKLEVKSDSDIDLFIDSTEQVIDISKFEKKLKRSIQLHFKNELSNKQLKNNIEKGVVL